MSLNIYWIYFILKRICTYIFNLFEKNRLSNQFFFNQAMYSKRIQIKLKKIAQNMNHI